MFIVFLKFADNKQHAADYMQGHMEWIEKGVADDVFLLVGSLQPNQGGGILAYNTSMNELQERVKADPFVQQNVVKAEVYELSAAKADQRLSFLLQ